VTGAINATRVAAGGCFSVAAKSDGTVMGWGDIAGYGSDTSLRILGGLTGIVEIAAGPTHVVALASGGTVYAFGENAGGVLGVGSGAASSAAVLVQGLANVTAIAAGHEASLAVGNGQVYFWGKHANGTIVTVPAALPAIGGSASSISFSDRVPVVVRGDGAVLVYDVASNAWQTPTGYSAIAKGAPSALNFSLAIGANGQLYASGDNTAGQLGQGDTNVHAGVVSVPGFANTSMVAVSNLTPSVIALKGDGSTWFWGADTVGQSGDSAAIGSSVPRQVTIGGSIKAIATGATFSAALDTAGNVWGWGDNRKGPLGSSLVGRSTPGLIAGVSNVQAIAAGGDGLMLYIMADGSVRMSGALPTFTTGLDPTPVSGLSAITAIAAGSSAYALRSDGVVLAWGANASGELGNGTTTPSSSPVAVQGITGAVTRISAGEQRAAAVTADGKVWVWGAAIAGTFAGSAAAQQIPGITDAADVSVGSAAVFVKRQNGGMYAWGTSGLADQAGQNLAQPYPIAFYQPVNSITAGSRNALGFIVGNTGVAWGFGTYGDISTSSPAIGDGAYVPRDRPVAVLAAGGNGSVDGNDWYLDLDTSSAETIPAASTPKALGVSRLFGSDAGLSLDATVKYKAADYGKPVSNYVFALVPPSFLAAVGSTQATKMRAKGMAKDDVSVLAQLTPGGWSFVDSQLLAYSQSTANAVGGSVNILNSVDSTQIPGGRFCIGYGESSGSMLTFEALREVLLLPGASSNLSGVPCILTGLYVDGPATSRVGSPATFSGSVVGLGPTGGVVFTDFNNAISGPMPLGGQSQAVSTASFSIALPVGMHSVGGLYSGDSKNAAAASSVPVSHQVVEAPPGVSTILLNGKVSSDLGSLATFTALVAGDSPTGSVQFKDGANNLGDAVPLVGGTATLRTSALALGAHSITGAYSGDGANTPGVSNGITHTVYEAITTQVSLATILNPNGSVTMSATVTGNVTPTGTVYFRDGGTTLAQSSLANGTASYTASNLLPGTHELYADYSGDPNNQAVSSGAVVQQVSLPHSLLNAPRLLNISTRGQVQTGFNVMIGGFVISGPTSKRVVIRAIGPSLANFGVAGALANPRMQLVHSDNNMLIASNDDWGLADNAVDLQRSGFAPSNAAESALLVTLAPGAYTAIVSGVADVTGVGLVEVYEVDHPEVSLINISTRGYVGTGFDVMIGGFVITGDGPQTVVVRATGPSLAKYNVQGALANPQLQLVRESDHAIIATNDNWVDASNKAQIESSGFAPSDPLESAIYITLDPGAYTAIVSGVNGGTGVGLVEVYKAP
jgi:alpha-tubulin suppressor-like RCC1 family protein